MARNLLIASIIVILCCSFLVTANPPMFPKYYYLGEGLNVLYLNPIDSGATPQSHRAPVIAFNTTANITTPDGKWSIPADVFVQEYDQCSMAGEVQYISGAYYYQKEVQNGFNFGIGLVGLFGASLSASMKSTSISASYYSGYYYDCYTKCSAYNMELYTSSRNFTPQFLSSLHALPLSFSAKNDSSIAKFAKFFDQYGTHIARGVLMGGRLEQRMETTVSDEATLKSKGVNVGVQAKATFENGITASIGGSHGSSSTEYKEFQKYSQQFSIEMIGGSPSYINNFPQWANSVKQFPAPLSYKLESLDLAIDPVYLPKDHNAKVRQIAVQQALEYYTETQGYIPGIMPAFKTCRSDTRGRSRNECTASCEDGWYAIGGGGYSPGPSQSEHNWRISASYPLFRNSKPYAWRVVMSEDYGSGIYNQFVSAYVMCAKAHVNATFGTGSVSLDVQTAKCASTNSHFDRSCTTPVCATGYTLLGGGCTTSQIDGEWPWAIRSSKPSNNRQWYCHSAEDYVSKRYDHNVAGYAICGKWTSTLKYSSFPNAVSIRQSTSSNVGSRRNYAYAQCPKNYVVTGGGCYSQNDSQGNKSWNVHASYPVSSNNGTPKPSGGSTTAGWQCSFSEDYGSKVYNQKGTAYAICVDLFATV